jgi:hypothetical protein
MKTERHRHIISLGQSCQTIYQINRHYKINYTNFFDYKRTTIEVLTDLLNNDFKDIILPENLSVTQDREHVRDNKYNFFIKHDFRNEQGVIPDNYLDLYPGVKSKFDHLIGKFRKILDSHETCLFIYARNRFIYNKYSGIREALELEKALKRNAPRLIPKILYIDTFENPSSGKFGDFSEAIPYNYELEENDNFFQKIRKPVQQDRWKGSDLAWDQILKNYNRNPGKFEWLEGYYNFFARHIRYHKTRILTKIKT